ncbi:hypothetical protein LHT11_08905 [Acetobacter indonesiensis]|uniref:hypothetical protein n=1 Tax=Acetobacter indonesiensis TaxID=104101 RepID=UPI001F2A506C|nr:hypothetical protein [Acetobacter indonesiensis]MCG0995319.1 hypothetical protein [Acetobacter indonesiensis]
MTSFTYYQVREGCAAALCIQNSEILDKKILKLRDKGIPTFGEKSGTGSTYPFSKEQVGMLAIALSLNSGALSDGKIGYIFYQCRDLIFRQVNLAIESKRPKNMNMLFKISEFTEGIDRKSHSAEGWRGKTDPCEFSDPLFLTREETYNYLDNQSGIGAVHIVPFTPLVIRAVDAAQETPPKKRGRPSRRG